MQATPLGQALLHTPQLSASVWRSAHFGFAPVQAERPVGHVPHLPATQGVPGQVIEQLPQCLESVARFVQTPGVPLGVPGQNSEPGAQSQVPFTHAVPAGHLS